MTIKEYKDSSLKLNQFHIEMVDLRIKAGTATFKDYSEVTYFQMIASFERAVWRGVNDSIQSFQGFLLKNR